MCLKKSIWDFFKLPIHMKIYMDVLVIVKKLRQENNYILSYLMRTFMMSQERLFILQLIQKIPDFKSWVLGCLKGCP
jgi:hypothetical protein